MICYSRNALLTTHLPPSIYSVFAAKSSYAFKVTLKNPPGCDLDLIIDLFQIVFFNNEVLLVNETATRLQKKFTKTRTVCIFQHGQIVKKEIFYYKNEDYVLVDIFEKGTGCTEESIKNVTETMIRNFQTTLAYYNKYEHL